MVLFCLSIQWLQHTLFANVNVAVWKKTSNWILMASCKFWIYISSEGLWQWMPNRQGALIPKAVSVLGSRTLPHCCKALKQFFFFFSVFFFIIFFCSGGMKVIICFWVTSQLRQFVGLLGHPQNVKCEVAMVFLSASQHSKEARLMMSKTLSRPSNCTKPEKQPCCKQSSQLASLWFLGKMWKHASPFTASLSVRQYLSSWAAERMFFCHTCSCGVLCFVFVCLCNTSDQDWSGAFLVYSNAPKICWIWCFGSQQQTCSLDC